MTPRQTKLVNASEAVDACKRELESDWPLSDLDKPTLTTMQRELYRSKHMDIAALDLASKTVMAVAVDPENFGKLMRLRAEKPSDFDAIMVLVDIELQRQAPAEQAAA